MDILRFITAGNVDDGKSTLTGRLLYDSDNILSDQLTSISQPGGTGGAIDLARLTDGLRAEREQGITIDVAYKYFSTPRRKFILADTPGHVQYTPNMVTGASGADLIIILIDARNGITEQTRRHSLVASLLDIRQVLVAVNKMDLVDYDERVFHQIVTGYGAIASALNFREVTYIPVSALVGENIAERSANMPWYKGQPLLPFLEQKELHREAADTGGRMFVQCLIRWNEGQSLCTGVAGRVTGGAFRVGEQVQVLPSGVKTRIRSITAGDKQMTEAGIWQSVMLVFEDDPEVTRGNVIAGLDGIQPQMKNELNATVCWMDTIPLLSNKNYLLQINSSVTRISIAELTYRLDVQTMQQVQQPQEVHLNDVAGVVIRSEQPVVYDPYRLSHANGGAILVDEESNLTVAAVILE